MRQILASILTLLLAASIAFGFDPQTVKRRMFVDPSSTTVSHNKVRLIVAPLTHQGKFYVGSYQLKVFPYFFKSETGTLKREVNRSESSRKELK